MIVLNVKSNEWKGFRIRCFRIQVLCLCDAVKARFCLQKWFRSHVFLLQVAISLFLPPRLERRNCEEKTDRQGESIWASWSEFARTYAALSLTLSTSLPPFSNLFKTPIVNSMTRSTILEHRVTLMSSKIFVGIIALVRFEGCWVKGRSFFASENMKNLNNLISLGFNQVATQPAQGKTERIVWTANGLIRVWSWELV